MTDVESPIDAFVRSIRAFAGGDAAREHNVVFYLMLNIGPGGYATVGRLPTPSPGHKETRTHGQVVGHFTLDQAEGRLRQLASVGVEQWFLVSSLYRFIEDEFEEHVEGYGAGAVRRRKDADFLEALRDDPEALAAFERRMVEAGGPPAPDDESILGLIARLREPSSLLELKDLKVTLEAWRSVVGPVAGRDARSRWFEHLTGISAGPRDD